MFEPAYLFKAVPFHRKFSSYSGGGLSLGYSLLPKYTYEYYEEKSSNVNGLRVMVKGPVSTSSL
jgi:hypothetical protein